MTETTVHVLPPKLADDGLSVMEWIVDLFSVRSWRLRRRLSQLHKQRLHLEQDLARRLSTRLSQRRRRR